MAEPIVFEHRIDWLPAFDKRDDNPKKNYGVCAMRIVFYVIGPKGAIQWMISTGWYTDSARKHLDGFPSSPWDDERRRPAAHDLGYHAREAQYDNQTPQKNCHLLGGSCFYDGSSLQAELPMEGFLSGGVDWLWPKLEAAYMHHFEGAEWPFHLEAAEAREQGRFV